MFLIAATENGGVLFQEGMRALLPDLLRQHGIYAVVLAAKELQPEPDDSAFTLGVSELVLAPIRDSGSMPPEELAETKRLVFAAADRVAELLRQGRRVLVSCAQGLNRSGLVSALALVRLGLSPDEAIERVRNGRSPYALRNDLFQRIVSGQV